MSSSSRRSSSGAFSSSLLSISIWRSNSSRWARMETYSPAAMENAPARRPATPARRGAAAAGAVPGPAPRDRLGGLHLRPLQPQQRTTVLALVGRYRLRRLILGHVHAVGASLQAAHDRQHRAHAEAPGQKANQAHLQAGAALPGLDAGLAELLPPDVRVPLLDLGELLED